MNAENTSSLARSIASLLGCTNTREKIDSNPFFLAELPDVAKLRVIQIMNTDEKFKLALSSKKMAEYVKITKANKHFYIVDLNTTEKVKVSRCEKVETLQTILGGAQSTKIASKKECKIWYGNRNLPAAERNVLLIRNIQYVFPFNQFVIMFRMKKMSENGVRRYLEDRALANWKMAIVRTGKIGASDLDAIMDMANKDRSIALKDVDIPKNYTHANAFKFGSIVYENAEWIRLTDLYSMKNCKAVQLGKNALTPDDLNSFLKFCTKSECSMFFTLALNINAKKRLSVNRVFHEIPVLKYNRQKHSFYLIAATNICRIMIIYRSYTKGITIWAISPHKSFKLFRSNFEPFTKEYNVLKMLTEQIELQKELKQLEKTTSEDVTQIIIKKSAIKEKLESVARNLDSENVYNENAIHYIAYE